MRVLVLLVSFLCATHLGAAQQSFDVSQPLEGQYLGRSMEVCISTSEALNSPEEVQAGWSRMECAEAQQDIPNRFLGRGNFWLRIKFKNSHTQPVNAIIEHNWPSDYLRIIHRTAEGLESDEEFGSLVFKKHPILHRYAAQKLSFPPGASEVLVHMKHIGALRIPIRIWSEETFQHSKFEENVAAGILVGVTLSMVLYNIFLFVTLRVTQQLYYVGFLITTFWFLLFFSGLSTYVPEPWRHLWSRTWIGTSALICVFLCYFTLHFLNIRERSKRLSWVFRLFAYAFLASAILEFWNREIAFLVWTFLLIPFLTTCTVAGSLGLWKRERPALFYLISFVLVMLGAAIENLITFDLVDQKWSFWPFFAASNIQSVLLSLAMGDKLHIDQKKSNAKIMTLNGELKKHILHVNEIVDEKTRDIRSIMASIPQGILMINRDLSIHPDYSAFCAELFEKKDLSGLDSMAVILSGAQLGPDKIAQLRSALDACLGENLIAFSLNESCFPREFSRQTQDKKTQILELDWHPILDASETIQRILVSARDVTHLRDLQIQSSESRHRLELIGEVINVDHQTFVRFLKSCRAFNAENQRLVANLKSNDPEINKILFINIHTMKGVARGLHLMKMSDLYHNIEHELSMLRMEQTEFSQEAFRNHFAEIDKMLDLYESVSTRELGRTHQLEEQAVVAVKDLEPFIHRIDKINLDDTRETRVFVSEVRELFTQLYFNDPQKSLMEVFSGIGRLAKDLKKEVPEIRLDLGQVKITREAEELLRNVFVHLLRNSMDHGIEMPDERKAKGKSSKGLIEVKIQPVSSGLLITYRDDGRGLDLKAIKATALRRGLIQNVDGLSLKDTVDLIFMSGFTTSATVSDISGRGVGMDAVSRYVQEQNGSISFNLPVHVDEEIEFLPFILQLLLPARHYRQQDQAA